jgi:hypothetical protein
VTSAQKFRARTRELSCLFGRRIIDGVGNNQIAKLSRSLSSQSKKYCVVSTFEPFAMEMAAEANCQRGGQKGQQSVTDQESGVIMRGAC